MIKREWRNVWLFLLILFGVFGFLADSMDQSTVAPRGLTTPADDREDRGGEAESTPAQEGIAKGDTLILQRRRPGAAQAVPTQGVRIAALTVNVSKTLSDWILSSTPPSLLELRI